MMAPGIGMLGYSIGGLVGGALLAVIGNRQDKFENITFKLSVLIHMIRIISHEL